MVGVDHTPAPEGPYCCVPDAFLCVGFGSSGIVKVCQSFFPVAAFKAMTLPRNLQHSYFASAARASSREEIGW